MTKEERTKQVIDSFKGLPGEYYLLKGVVNAPQATVRIEPSIAEVWDLLYCTSMLLQRMEQVSSQETSQEKSL